MGWVGGWVDGYIYIYICMYSVQVRMSISNIVITLKDEVFNSLTPSKYTVLNGNFVFDLRDFFQ